MSPPRKLDTSGTRYLQPCPDCGQLVVWPDNDTLLDWPAVPFSALMAPWLVVRVLNVPPAGRTRVLAMTGQEPKNGMGHTLHVHQPETSIVRRGRQFVPADAIPRPSS